MAGARGRRGARTTMRATLGAVTTVGLLLTVACTADQSQTSVTRGTTTATAGTAQGQALPPDAVKIMGSDPYKGAQWSYLVVDPSNGQVIYSNLADRFMFLASQSKHFTVGTVYNDLGVDQRITTPVYATAAPAGGTLTGNLVLVASGDLALGGRNADQGKFDFATSGIDQVYADAIPGAVVAPGDPLAGLNSMAQQVAKSGITRVDGDVLVDPRLWDTYKTAEGLVPPIFVNDNLVDLQAQPGQPGQPATIQMLPANDVFTVDASQLTTGAADSDAAMKVAADEANPSIIHVSGSVPAAKSSLTVYRVPDAASWARQLFIEALRRNGVTVTSTVRTNDVAGLPAKGSYDTNLKVATLQSAPLSEMGGMILATSYNTGANAFLCMLAAKAGSTDCEEGLPAVRDLAAKAGISPADLVLVDGQGADPAAATPQAVATWLQWATAQPWGKTFEAGQPVLGERGSLAGVGTDSPAKGKVIAKTATKAAAEPVTGRLYISVQGLSGYLDEGGGRRLVFVEGVSDAVFPDVPRGIFQVGTDVGMFAAALQQAQQR